jgi:thiol-disulfide isomerase/thioredoxin
MKPFLYAGLIFAVLMTSACGRRETTAPLPVLKAAPAWTLKDVNGREVKSADFKGKVVVVDFWATWCAPCRKEMPLYDALQKKYADRGLVILGFSLDDLEPSEVKQVGEQLKVGYPLIMADTDIADSFGSFEKMPTAFLIDREGNIRHMKSWELEVAEYEKLIVSLL